MADKFAKWDRFSQHFLLTQDPHKALRWAQLEERREQARLDALRREADLLAALSVARSMERSLKKSQ